MGTGKEREEDEVDGGLLAVPEERDWLSEAQRGSKPAITQSRHSIAFGSPPCLPNIDLSKKQKLLEILPLSFGTIPHALHQFKAAMPTKVPAYKLSASRSHALVYPSKSE